MGSLLTLLLETAPNGILILDESDRVLAANRHAEALLHPGETIVGREVSGLVRDDSLARLARRLREARAEDPKTRRMSDAIDVTLAVGEGPDIDAEATITPIDTPTGRLLGVALVDVTTRKKLERALSERNRDLQQFNALVSHDLQEPLRTIVSYCELLEAHSGPGLDARGNRYVEHARRGAKRMQTLLDGLVEYARLGRASLRLERASARSIVDAAVEALRAQARGAGAVIDTRGVQGQVDADPVMLRQVFQNLVANSLKFRSESTPHVEITSTSTPRGVEFVVADNGIGIAAGHEERVFDMFRRLHTAEEYPGSGIGLAFARRIVEAHEGKIWAASAPLRGARIHFTIPRRT